MNSKKKVNIWQLSESQMLEKTESLIKNKDLKGAEWLLQSWTNEHSLTLYSLLMKYRLEEKQGKCEQALRTCNLILFMQPSLVDVHQAKLRLLKQIQAFDQLSDCLVATLTLQPNIQFNQL